MIDFDEILEKCLDELADGASTVDECLVRYPEQATQLKPLLLTAARLQSGRVVQPSAVFKARARAKLTLHMQEHPRARARSRSSFLRLAASLAALLLALLVTGTAYAQGALPGDPFYGWKLTSEYAWRTISSDPANVDLIIANRRIDEMNAVSDDPARKTQALKGYQEVVDRLKSEVDANTLERILPKIEVEHKPTPESMPSVPSPIVNVTATPQPESTPTQLSDFPQVHPTVSKPKLIPTIEIPPPMR